jgi:DNA-binding PadR family transcriptional regulator
MAARSATPYVILGLLRFGPLSGYDIRAELQRATSSFWSESYGQIYPHLARLAAEGRCERRREPRAGRPDRQVYSLTARGREDLQRWLRDPPRVEPFRSELLLKLFLGAAGDPADSAAHVRRYRAHQAGLLRVYAAVGRRLRAEHRGHPGLAYWMATLRYGQRRAAAVAAWCDETLRALGRRRPRRAAPRAR